MIRYLPPLATGICAIVIAITVALGGHIYRWEAFTWTAVIIGLSIALALNIKTVRIYEKTVSLYERLHR